jgi:hypothetical protein
VIIFKQNKQANTYVSNLCVIKWNHTKVINEIEKVNKLTLILSHSHKLN